jgi:hypothetical protein
MEKCSREFSLQRRQASDEFGRNVHARPPRIVLKHDVDADGVVDGGGVEGLFVERRK